MNNSYQEKFIYLIRHGETEYNKKGFLQGSSIDSSLNENGLKQAHAFYETYKNIHFDKIYTSVLKRSIESVSKFIEKGIPHEEFSEINEINWGKLEGKILTPISWIKLKKLASRWSAGETYKKIEGGESPDDVAYRQKIFLDKILSRNDEKTILICMHGRAMRIFLCLLTGKAVSQMDQFHHSNLCLYLVKFNHESLTYNIIKNNDVAHLKSEKK